MVSNIQRPRTLWLQHYWSVPSWHLASVFVSYLYLAVPSSRNLISIGYTWTGKLVFASRLLRNLWMDVIMAEFPFPAFHTPCISLHISVISSTLCLPQYLSVTVFSSKGFINNVKLTWLHRATLYTWLFSAQLKVWVPVAYWGFTEV